jgi:polyhydroxyalkanoate synthesis regulator phasin
MLELCHCTAEEALLKLPINAAAIDVVNASLLSSLNGALIEAIATASTLDLSHTDLSSGTADEVEAQAAVDELVLRRGELQRAKKDYGEAHKEKDFPKIQEKKKVAKQREDDSNAAIARLETKLAKLNNGFESIPWGMLTTAWGTQCPSHLSLKNCALTAFALSKLRVVLAPHVCELFLDGNDLEDRGAEEVTELLAESSKLKRLAVRNCSFTDLGMGTLAAGVARSTALEHLDARNNGLATAGASQAFVAVQRFRPVTCLL